MNIIIRRAVQHDFAGVHELIKEFAVFQKTPEKVSISLQQMINEQDKIHCIIAEADHSEIVGFATYFSAYYSWTGRAIYLDDLYVKPSFRNAQVGKNLLDAVINIAKEEQCIKVRWQVSKWNENAIGFYKKMGALVDETEINCDLYL